jgi:hypothetical protein
MKLSQLDRRSFIEAMLLTGLAACATDRRAMRALRNSRPGDAGTGRLFTQLAQLSDQLVAGAIAPREFAARADDRLMELELEPDVLADWEERGPERRVEGMNGYRAIHTRRLAFDDRGGALKAVLFYTPAGTSNPPHEHHNLISVKRVLKGNYHVREYERLRRIEPGAIAIRQVSEHTGVGLAGPCVAMTDDRRAVHWFGSQRDSVLALNIVVEDALPPSATFHGATRPTGRYFLDPTAAPDREGVIIARSIDDQAATEFSRHRVDEFPSRLTRPG